MKKLICILALTGAFSASAQENCTDGIDNDGDTFVDLNDTECDCGGLGIADTLTSLIPNPSFEDQICCPTSYSMLNCAEFWMQASIPTSDYFHTCGLTTLMDPPAFPIPGGGEGWAGFFNNADWKENIGACLLAPMTAGTPYVLNLWLSWSGGDPDLNFSFYGTPNCSDLPWSTVYCPIGEGSWMLLDEQMITFTTLGEWIEVTLEFTPTVDINAVTMGGDCAIPIPGWNYYYVDELVLLDSASFSGGNITESGNWCDGDLALNVSIDTVGGTWQWFYEGVALVGETGTTLDVMPTGAGTYQATYTVGTDCELMSYTFSISDAPVADFTFSNVCDGDPVNFTDESTIGSGSITNWDWDFGDLSTSTLTDPSHLYAAPGTYTVELTVTSDDGCTHTITQDVTVSPNPVADFEFEILGNSSSGGLTGGCIFNTVDFVDGSTGPITEWDWDFGDLDGSASSDPSHDYAAEGTYTITLTVTTAAGCTDDYSMDIIMTDSPVLDVIFNNPNCFGFTDGSVTVNVSGGSGSEVYEIKNDADVLVNVGGSNTANSLGGGWYTIHVDDGSGCSGDATVFLDEPEALDVDLNLFMPVCYGDQNGYAVVEEVFNAQGDLTNITYIWNPDPASVSGLGADSSYNLTAGTYSLIITDDNGCSNEITFEITQPDELIFTEIGYEPAFCRLFSYQSGNGVVYASAGGGTPDYAYEWENLATGDTWIPTTWGGLNPGDYQMTVVDDAGCILTQVVTVDSLNPIADFDITSAELDGNLEGTAVACATFTNTSQNFSNINDPLADTTFWWNLDTPKNPWILTHDFFETFDTCYADGGVYEVCLVAQNKNGCVDTNCKTITVFTPLDITNVNIFTPDGDGVNDQFTFTHVAKGVMEFHCVIVNRWGQKLAEINDVNVGWDGTDGSGSKCRDGVYFYTYEGKAENSEVFAGQGTIQIVGSGL